MSISRSKSFKVIGLLIFVVSCPILALTEPVETIINNGPSNNRIDIAIMGDGYTASQMQKYRADVQQFMQLMFAQDPYREYQHYYNVHRIDVTSNQSGADHPERGSFVDTALDATYNCNSTQRLICVNNSKATAALNRSLTPVQSDITLVIVNDSEYGGSGGSIAVASVNTAAVEIILHELGHSFGLLADEYGGTTCGFGDGAPNVTQARDRAFIKWNYWIDASTPIPTFTTTPGVPGLYEGALYCNNGYFRPTYDSKMRTLDKPFEQINMEQLIKRIYNIVSPLDASSPTNSAITLQRGQTQAFSITKLVPFSHSLDVTWFVDGQPRNASDTFLLDTAPLSVGSHTVEILVKDNTSAVRQDLEQLLAETRQWSLMINAAPTPTPSPTPGPGVAPVLITEQSSTRAIALDSVTLTRDPFPIFNTINFSSDQRTRIMLFANNVDLLPGEPITLVTAQAENGQQVVSMQVEYVGRMPTVEGMTMVVVRLPDGLATPADVLVSITVRGLVSNKVLVAMKPT